jgi:hypothetical protein
VQQPPLQANTQHVATGHQPRRAVCLPLHTKTAIASRSFSFQRPHGHYRNPHLLGAVTAGEAAQCALQKPRDLLPLNVEARTATQQLPRCCRRRRRPSRRRRSRPWELLPRDKTKGPGAPPPWVGRGAPGLGKRRVASAPAAPPTSYCRSTGTGVASVHVLRTRRR